MTNQEILRIAMEQSAIDSNCDATDFMEKENKIVISEERQGSRRYLKLPFYCNLVSYGNNIVASVSKEIEEVARKYIGKYALEHCFETPNLHVLEEELKKRGQGVCFMAEYFLPDVNELVSNECNYETRIIGNAEFVNLYIEDWGNALCADRRELDVLGVGAYDGDKLIGLAACSADCEMMWQIGVDVLPTYRRQGIASALTSNLVLEILKRDKVPFYCAAWSNIKSVRNAITSGFRPAWVEVTAKSLEFIADLNK